jgi:hypothetical protein
MRLPFDSPLHPRDAILYDGLAKGKAMEIDPKPTHAKVAHIWEPR